MIDIQTVLMFPAMLMKLVLMLCSMYAGQLAAASVKSL